MAHFNGATDLHDRPLRELVRLLAEQASDLAHQEIALAKAEVEEKKAQAKPVLGAAVVASALGVVCLSALTSLAITGLAAVLPVWAAALIVAVVAGLAAVALGASAKRRLRALSPVPEKTLLTLKEDLRWAKLQRTFVTK
jgi:uncharacterized membrane protein YqjE